MPTTQNPSAKISAASDKNPLRALRRWAGALTAAALLPAAANAAAFTAGNLTAVQAAASASNTTVSVIELNPALSLQTSGVQSIAVSGTGASAIRVSASATSTLYVATTNDGTLMTFTGANSTDTASNVNTLNPRAVVTFDAAGTFAIATTYTGTSGNQTRGANSLNNSTWYIGDQGGLYSNGTSTASPTGNFRGIKSFGGTVFGLTASASVPPVFTISAATGGTTTSLPGLANGATSRQDFYLISSGDNGSTYDVLYVLDATSATVGTIFKYSLVAGSWTANGSYTTSFGGFGMAAADNGSGALIYVSTGTGATTANKVMKLADTAGYNATIAITTANNVTLYTAPTGTIIKGVSFAPVAAGPTIATTGTPAAVSTTYGTASATPGTFTVSGANMTAGITITPPAGFEVATTSDFSSTIGTNASPLTVGAAPTISTTAIYVRLAATAAVAGSPYSGSIVCSSSGTTSQNVATTSSTVSPLALTVVGLTGDSKMYDGFTTATLSGTPALNGVLAGDVGNVTLGGTPVANFNTAAVGTTKPITVTGYTISGSASTNYSVTQPAGLTADISTALLTVTANNVTKPFGNTLTGGPGSSAFTSMGLVNGETIGSVTITYGAGAGAADPAGTYNGSVTPSDATGGTFMATNYTINYVAGNLTVSANPTINVSGTLTAVNTTYGTASASPTSFTTSGGNLTGDLTIAAPAGFEVSTTMGSGYAASILLTQTGGTVGSTTIYVRLAATTAAGTYSGNVTVSGGGATAQNVATASSTVAQKNLNIMGVSGVSREYDVTNIATLSGTPAYSGLENGESFSVTGTASATFANKTIGIAKAITVTGYTAPPANYTVTQPTGLTADITARNLTVSGTAVTNKQYDANANATITGTLVGVISPDVVNFVGTGTFATSTPGTGISVTAACTLSGADAGNYTLTQPTGLTGDITKANQTITFAALANKAVGDADFNLTATASSGLAVIYVSSNPAVATVSGNTVHIVAAGTTNITASQAGDSNYNAALDVVRTQTVIGGPTTLGAGDIAVIGYNTSASPDNFAILVLKELNGGTVFFVNDDEVATDGGTSFTDTSEGEASFTVKAGQVIPAGTVIVLPWGASAVSTTTYDWSSTSGFGFGNNNEEIYIYTAASLSSLTPTAFIYGVKIGTSPSARPTGLTTGTTFIAPPPTPALAAGRYKRSGALYAGTQAELLGAIGNIATNWETAAAYTFAASDWAFAVNPDTTVTISDPVIAEGNSGPTTLSFTVTRSSNTGAFSLSYSTADGTATTANSDYVSASGTVTFTAGGALTQPIDITINGDTTVEPDETVLVNLSNLVNTSGVAGIADNLAVGTITADDYEAPVITTHPLTQTISTGAAVTLSVVATGFPTPTYQWYAGVSGDTANPISGATSASFTTPALIATADYWVRATNVAGAADSNTATISVAYGAAFSSASSSVLVPNTNSWNPAGVTVGGTTFKNLGLQGVGRVAASSIDPATGESLGSISDMQITGWKKNGDGSYSGTLNALPDRGYNSGSIFSNYAARINAFDFTFTPYTSSTPTTDQNQIALTFAGSTRFTYDDGAGQKYTTGLNATGTTTLFGTTVPAASGATTQADGTVTNRLTLDSEGLILDKRTGKGGSGWIGDEYGGYIYHFNSSKQIDGQLQLPAALIPHITTGGAISFVDSPANVDGRRVNQGMEGIALSPDGTKLFGLMQSATMQDSTGSQPTRLNARLLVYDVSGSDTPNDPSAQYVIQLPVLDETGSTTNGATVTKTAAQSSILALNDHQLLILSRDGNGRGASGSPVFKSILLADLNSATNIDGTYDAAGSAVAPGGVLTVGVTPLTWTEALNLIGKFGATTPEVAKFNLNLSTAPGDLNSICEKWEALALVSANDPANPNDYFLFVGNDNDFNTAAIKYFDASGTLQTAAGTLENDTLVLAYRVQITGTDNQAPFVANTIPNQSASAGSPFSFPFAAGTFTDPESGALTYSATKSDDSALPAWLSFNPGTRTFSGTPAIGDAGILAVKVTAADGGTPNLWISTTFTIDVSGTPPTFSFASATYSVQEDAGVATLTINRTGGMGATSVNVSTTDGAAIDGTDYTALTNQAVPFALNQTSATVDVTVANRPGGQASRAFTASLSGGATAAPASTTVTITDTPGSIAFTALTQSANPVNSSGQPNNLQITLQRTGGAGGAASVQVSKTGGTILASELSFTSPTTVSFADGETSKTFNLQLNAVPATAVRTIILGLSNAVAASIGSPDSTTITINKKPTTAPTLTAVFGAPSASGVTSISGSAIDGGTISTGLNRVELIVANVAGTSAPILITNTPGAFNEDFQLEHGSNKLTVTAFDNSGNKASKTATLTFVDPAVTALAGTYTGLLLPAVTPSNDTSGFLTITTTATGTVSGKLTTGGITAPFSGALDSAGNVHFKPTSATAFDVIDKVEFNSFLGSLAVHLASAQAVGTLKTSALGTTLATATAELQATSASPSLLNASLAQKYTVAYPSKAQTGLTESDYPQGDGYASVTVMPNGSVSATGVLADGTAYTAAGRLHVATATTQAVSLHTNLYRKQGSFATELVFDLSTASNTDSDILGIGSLWIRPELPRARYYKTGWISGASVDAVGARFTVPVGASVLPGLGATSPNAELQFEDGNLPALETRDLNISVTNAFTNKSPDPALKLSITKSTGVFSGVFTHTDGTKPAYKGIILQEGGNAKGFGFFLSTPPLSYGGSGQGGGVSLLKK
jgi:hypothetical protein